MDAPPPDHEGYHPKEGLILQKWIAIADDRLVSFATARKFFRYYNAKDLLWARPGFAFWQQGFFAFLDFLPSLPGNAIDMAPDDRKVEEERLLKGFCKWYLCADPHDEKIANSTLNVVQCAMKLAVNCWRNRVYMLKKRADQPNLGSAHLAVQIAYGVVDETQLIDSVVQPFFAECAKEKGFALDSAMERGAEWVLEQKRKRAAGEQ